MWRPSETTFDVYIEAPQETSENRVRESRAIKLSYPDVTQPLWAIGALRRIRNVTEIIDLGESTDRNNHRLRTIRLIAKAASDLEVTKTEVMSAMIAARGSHL